MKKVAVVYHKYGIYLIEFYYQLMRKHAYRTTEQTKKTCDVIWNNCKEKERWLYPDILSVFNDFFAIDTVEDIGFGNPLNKVVSLKGIKE